MPSSSVQHVNRPRTPPDQAVTAARLDFHQHTSRLFIYLFLLLLFTVKCGVYLNDTTSPFRVICRETRKQQRNIPEETIKSIALSLPVLWPCCAVMLPRLTLRRTNQIRRNRGGHLKKPLCSVSVRKRSADEDKSPPTRKSLELRTTKQTSIVSKIRKRD